VGEALRQPVVELEGDDCLLRRAVDLARIGEQRRLALDSRS
jgi:hypothetical protein